MGIEIEVEVEIGIGIEIEGEIEIEDEVEIEGEIEIEIENEIEIEDGDKGGFFRWAMLTGAGRGGRLDLVNQIDCHASLSNFTQPAVAPVPAPCLAGRRPGGCARPNSL